MTLVLTIISLPFVLKSQEYETYKLITASKLNIRNGPSTKSDAIGIVPRNQLVKILSKTDKYEEINEMKGNWIKIEYKNEIGYVFNGYLSANNVFMNSHDTIDIVLDMYQNLNFNPKLNWYGVYPTAEGDRLKKIKPKPYLNQKYLDLAGISFVEDSNDKLLFSIGLNLNLDDGITGVKTYYEEKWLTGNNLIDLILYTDKYGFRNGHQLKSSCQKIEDGIYGEDSFANYKLFYVNSEDRENIEKVLLYNPKQNYLNQIPELKWYGDIDGDGLPEFLFFVNGDNKSINIEFVKVIRENGKLKCKKLLSKRPEFAGGC